MGFCSIASSDLVPKRVDLLASVHMLYPQHQPQSMWLSLTNHHIIHPGPQCIWLIQIQWGELRVLLDYWKTDTFSLPMDLNLKGWCLVVLLLPGGAWEGNQHTGIKAQGGEYSGSNYIIWAPGSHHAWRCTLDLPIPQASKYILLFAYVTFELLISLSTERVEKRRGNYVIEKNKAYQQHPAIIYWKPTVCLALCSVHHVVPGYEHTHRRRVYSLSGL